MFRAFGDARLAFHARLLELGAKPAVAPNF
jgi:hypothetical protein